jgi:hypothetical protein
MIPACIKLCSLASGKGKRHEHAAPAVAAPVRRGGAGQFEFGTTAASAGILSEHQGLPIIQNRGLRGMT